MSLGLGGAVSSKGRHVRFYFSHGLSVVDLLAASRTLIKLQPWHRIGLAMRLAGPLCLTYLILSLPQAGHLVTTIISGPAS
jgi:hypothetical protein